ncbi:MAG: ATP-binding protein [Leptospiraceae bacterium]|nr:ATP-binding protein [Leptospiraceae bacterium]MCP5493182.1 ATP-binding protein [Leptospiraceae bacterium]
MKEIFKRLIVDFQEKEITNIYKRDYEIPLNSKKIISLIGVRRSGKSSVLFYLINTLKENTPSQNIIYINFEDDRLFGTKLSDLDSLIEGYYELYPTKRKEIIYFFLDEVQAVDKWEQFVRRIYDTLNVVIFITGSSSKLLSSEIATSLRGRTISYEIFPLSFKEYLQFKNIEVNLHSSISLSFIKNSLEEYLLKGGFPEIVNEPLDIQKRILSDYVNLIVYKDIIERYGITNTALLKHLIKYTFSNISTLISFNKLYNDYKSQGFKLAKDTLFEYFSHLQDAYTLFSVPIFRSSIKEEQRNPKKIYTIDNGFKYIYNTFLSDDFGKLYENLVFLHLRRKTDEIYYLKQNQEVDFYCIIDGQKQILNVSYDLSDRKTKEREIKGLLEAMHYMGIKNSILITKEADEIVDIDGKKINITPLFKWLL